MGSPSPRRFTSLSDNPYGRTSVGQSGLLMSFPEQDDDNPYRSPASVPSDEQPVCVNGTPHEHLSARLIKRGHLYRLIRLSGRIDADIEWNGRWPVEFVRVHGQTSASQFAFWYCPKFQFSLAGGDTLFRVTVDIRLNHFLQIVVRAFRISVDEETVYSEGQWRTVRE